MLSPLSAFALIGLYRKERHANNLDRAIAARDQVRIEPKVTLRFTGYVEHILPHNVTWKLLQCCCHVLKRWRSVARSYALVRMAGDVIRHALRDAGAVCDLFESVTPSVIGLHMRVVNSQRADPICEPLTHLCVGRLLVFASVLSFAPPS